MSTASPGSADFGNSVAAFRPFLLRLALLQLQDKATAEDAVQETMLAALLAHEKFEGRSSLKTWLVSILRHKTLDALRTRARVRPAPKPTQMTLEEECNLEPFEALFDNQENWAETKDVWTDPETVAERTAFFQVLDACMTNLPERTSRAFLMREWLEAEPSEICEQLGVTPENLRVLLYRARMQLRVCLDHKWERKS